MREFNEEEMKRLYNLIEMSDEEFYEKFLSDALLEEVSVFLDEFPKFMEDEIADDEDSEELLHKILELLNKK